MWTKDFLGQRLKLTNGKAIKTNQTGSFPVFGSNGIIGFSGEYRYEDGVIIGRVGAYCGSIERCKGKFWASDNAIVGTTESAAEDTNFHYYLLKSSNLRRFAGGAAQPLLTQGFLRSLEMYFPSLPTQQKIASILSAYDDLIENNNRRIQILEEMAQRIYREWFVHFRFPGHENVKMVDSELGKIPEGWEVKNLEVVCSEIFSGGTPSTSNNEYWDGNICWLSSGETRNKLILDTKKFITSLGVDNSSTRLALEGDVVIASAGQGNTRGQTSLCMIDTYINQSIIALRADNKSLISDYLFVALSTKYQQLRAVSDSSSSRGSLTQELLRNFLIIVAPFNLQKDFQSFAKASFLKSGNLRSRNQTLRKTRDLLLPRLISGRLDVEELDIAT
jgi:type I restriction enzyme S subunit